MIFLKKRKKMKQKRKKKDNTHFHDLFLVSQFFLAPKRN